MLEQIGHEIWTVDGSMVEVLGFNYPTRMAVIRLADRRLFVWSCIPLLDELRKEVDSLGKVAYIVAPNSLHHLSIPDWQKAYPDALVYAAPKLREKRKDISFDQVLENTPNMEWAGEIDQVVIQGNLITSEVVFFHIPSGTVLFTDLVQQFPKDWFSGWRRMVAGLDLMLGSEPSVPRKFRMAFIKRRAARASLERVTAWPARLVLMAHGELITEDAKGFIGRAFRWLKV